MFTRKKFLQHSALATAGISLLEFMQPLQAAEYKQHLKRISTLEPNAVAGDEDFWNFVREQYTVSPNIINAGYRINVIPSEAEATLDIRALPDEDMTKFYETLKGVINDPVIKLIPQNGSARPGAPPSALDNVAFRAIEATAKKHYDGVTVLPTMSTGATDMAFLRAKGVQCYGIGPAIDSEDGPKGFGAHSDQERILESALYQFVKFHYDLVAELAGAK